MPVVLIPKININGLKHNYHAVGTSLGGFIYTQAVLRIVSRLIYKIGPVIQV